MEPRNDHTLRINLSFYELRTGKAIPMMRKSETKALGLT